jgi:hypothetical protein
MGLLNFFSKDKDNRTYRKFRLTGYVISEQSEFLGTCKIPVFDLNKKILAVVEPAFFSDISLQGSGKLRNGLMLNVASAFVDVKHEEYIDVLNYHKKYLTKRPFGYSGLIVQDDKVVKALAFRRIEQNALGEGYGIIREIPLQPFKTLAADIGATSKSEPKWKGKGGVVPPKTKVFIKEFKNMKLPDGSTHDGWFVVNDTGGGIFGVHFDVFCGSRQLMKKVKFPHVANVWFESIEERIAEGYNYGLVDK